MKKKKTAHEPEAEVMSAEEAWEDSQRAAAVLQRNLLKVQPVVRLQVPLTMFMSALDGLSREELTLLQKRVAERLAA